MLMVKTIVDLGTFVKFIIIIIIITIITSFKVNLKSRNFPSSRRASSAMLSVEVLTYLMGGDFWLTVC
jgi:hypothetical protein